MKLDIDLNNGQRTASTLPGLGGDRADYWQRPFEVLRQKWHEVPAGNGRVTTTELLAMPTADLLAYWSRIRTEATTGDGFAVRGWYHLLYKDIFRGKRVLDVGSGLGIDGLTFAQHGALVTCLDIVESNLAVLQRLSRLLDLPKVAFCYLHDLKSLRALPIDYDVIWCQGSLINAPFEIVREEAGELLRHLPVGGRWVELAYPKARWDREGRLPFGRWGEKTDGGAPWVEWYDLDKVRARLAPAEFETVLHLNFCQEHFNWFDLLRIA